MSDAAKGNLISEAEYLAGEQTSPLQREYIAGAVYPMPDACATHDLIRDNVLDSLKIRLAGKRCQPHGFGTKVRIELLNHARFYYPDNAVVCIPNPRSDAYQDKPVVIFEVLSRNSRRMDEVEKKDAYLTIPSLRVYALVEQEKASVVVFRRLPSGYVREIYEGLSAMVPLGEVGAELPLAEIYDRIEFTSERDAGEA